MCDHCALPEIGLLTHTFRAPAITYTVTSSDGQVSPSALVVTVLPGEQDANQPAALTLDN